MQKFTLTTDSTCDLYHDFLGKNGIRCIPLAFTIEEKDGTLTTYRDDFRTEEEYIAFYNRLRSGALSRTSKLNTQEVYEFFLGLAEEGATDVLHFTISSGLASSVDIARIAAAEVQERFPSFRVFAVDPLTATVGQGALVMLAAEWRDAGKGVEETYEYILSLRQYIQHFIMADDLDYLRRGGRVSGATAVIGGMLNIKPMLTFNAEGKLELLEKNRGLKKTFSSFLSKMDVLPVDMDLKRIYIVHTDNPTAAEELRQAVVAKCGIEPHVSIMGPIIGSHLGPNGIGFGYISSKERNKI